MTYDKESDEINQIGENDENRITVNIEVLKLVTLSPKKYIYNIEKGYDEINRINMIGDKESDGRDHIGENHEEILTDDIEVLKLVKLSYKRYIDNIDK